MKHRKYYQEDLLSVPLNLFGFSLLSLKFIAFLFLTMNHILSLILVFHHIPTFLPSSSSYPVYSVHRNYNRDVERKGRRQSIPIKKDAVKESLNSKKSWKRGISLISVIIFFYSNLSWFSAIYLLDKFDGRDDMYNNENNC